MTSEEKPLSESLALITGMAFGGENNAWAPEDDFSDFPKAEGAIELENLETRWLILATLRLLLCQISQFQRLEQQNSMELHQGHSGTKLKLQVKFLVQVLLSQ